MPSLHNKLTTGHKYLDPRLIRIEVMLLGTRENIPTNGQSSPTTGRSVYISILHIQCVPLHRASHQE